MYFIIQNIISLTETTVHLENTNTFSTTEPRKTSERNTASYEAPVSSHITENAAKTTKANTLITETPTYNFSKATETNHKSKPQKTNSQYLFTFITSSSKISNNISSSTKVTEKFSTFMSSMSKKTKNIFTETSYTGKKRNTIFTNLQPSLSFSSQLTTLNTILTSHASLNPDETENNSATTVTYNDVSTTKNNSLFITKLSSTSSKSIGSSNFNNEVTSSNDDKLSSTVSSQSKSSSTTPISTMHNSEVTAFSSTHETALTSTSNIFTKKSQQTTESVSISKTSSLVVTTSVKPQKITEFIQNELSTKKILSTYISKFSTTSSKLASNLTKAISNTEATTTEDDKISSIESTQPSSATLSETTQDSKVSESSSTHKTALTSMGNDFTESSSTYVLTTMQNHHTTQILTKEIISTTVDLFQTTANSKSSKTESYTSEEISTQQTTFGNSVKSSSDFQTTSTNTKFTPKIKTETTTSITTNDSEVSTFSSTHNVASTSISNAFTENHQQTREASSNPSSTQTTTSVKSQYTTSFIQKKVLTNQNHNTNTIETYSTPKTTVAITHIAGDTTVTVTTSNQSSTENFSVTKNNTTQKTVSNDAITKSIFIGSKNVSTFKTTTTLQTLSSTSSKATSFSKLGSTKTTEKLTTVKQTPLDIILRFAYFIRFVNMTYKEDLANKTSINYQNTSRFIYPIVSSFISL